MKNTETRILKDLYKDYFRIGVACESIHEPFLNNEIGNEDKEDLIVRQFNSMTFGNELKPAYNMGFASEEATEEYLPFVINPNAKTMLDFARAHKMPVRGHVLVWHSQCPREAFCKGYKPVTEPVDPEVLKENPRMKFFAKLDPVCYVDRDTMLKRLRSYIFSLMEYMYKNDYMRTIYAWDVVNEAIELADKTPTGLRNSYWYQIIGDDFIYWTFKFANEAVAEMSHKYAKAYGINPADETAIKEICPKLFYNDYNEFDPDKKASIIAMLKREGHGHGSILGENLIDGIGMQAHISDNNDIEEYAVAVRDYASLGCEIHLTELDVKCTASGVNAEYYQAVFYKAFFEMLVREKKNGSNITAVTFWGLTDDNSWIHGADPLLFHGDLSIKKAFDAVCYALSGESLGEPEPVVIDLSDRFYDFEGDNYLEAHGIKMKGFGECVVQSDVVHSGKNAILNKFRGGDWCGVSFDVSDFIGQTIDINAWVKSEAPMISLSADEGNELPVIASADTSSGEWVKLTGRYSVPSDVHSMRIYFGTKGEQANGFKPLYIDEVEIKLVGLMESFEGKSNISAIRGMGHLPVLMVTDRESVDGKSHSLCVARQEKDATVKFNISSYIGNKVSFAAYVKTADKVIRAGLDGAVSKEYANIESDGNWDKISFVIDLDRDLKAAEIYIETDGNSEYFVDDIFVSIV